MGRRIVAAAGRPESWLGLLLVWALLSAARSWHTPWARAAGTEALRWSAGIALALVLGGGLRHLRLAAQALTVLLAALVLGVLVNGLSASDMVTGAFRDHQLCASALLVLLPFAVALALAADTPSWRWAAQGISVAAAVCLALTQTRSAWIGAGVAALLFAGLWLKRAPSHASRRQHRRAWLLPALLALSVAGAAALLASATELGTPLAARARTLQAVGQDRDWRLRVQAWQGAARMIAARPVAGWGLGRYPGAQWAWTRQGRPLSPAQRPSLSEQAHDLYLQTAAEMGAVGLLLSLAFVGTLSVCCFRALSGPNARRWGLTRALRIATLSLLAGQAVDALASPSYQFAEVSLLVWAGLGVGMAALQRRQAAEETVILPAPLRRALRFSFAGAAALTVAAQALPVGLLSPVEAYDNASLGWHLVPSTGQVPNPVFTSSVSQVHPSASGSVVPVQFTLTAVYADGSGNQHTVVMNTDSTAVFTTSGGFSAFDASIKGQLDVSKKDANTTYTYKGKFKDSDSGTLYYSASCPLKILSAQ